MARLWIDAMYLKTRQGGRIVSVAVTIAVGVDTDGRREAPGMSIGLSEAFGLALPFRTDFLRDLARCGLSGVELVVGHVHEGIKAAAARVLSKTWQRCRVHCQRNALALAGKGSRRVVSAFVATAFAQPDHTAASAQWRLVADQMRGDLPKLAGLVDGAEENILADIGAPPVLASNVPRTVRRYADRCELRSNIGRGCTPRTRSSARRGRSSGAPMSSRSGSLPDRWRSCLHSSTRRQSVVWSEQS